MSIKKPPSEPANTTVYKCEVVIRGRKRTVLKISPHYQKRNKEFCVSKKKKVRENLNQYLLNDEIIKGFVQQLDGKKVRSEGINADWPAWKYYVYEAIVDPRNDMTYLIIFFLDDNNPELIGVITVYPCE